MSMLISVLGLLFAFANADQLNSYAQQSASAHCAYSGFQSSKYCPSIAGFTYDGARAKTPEGVPILPAMIGIGYDPVTKHIGLPVTSFSYSAGAAWTNSKGAKFGVPDEVTITLSAVTTPINQVFHFTDYDAYYQQAIASYDGNCLGGMFASSQNIENMYTQYFAGTKSLSVSQEYHPLFSLSMKSASPALDPIAAAAIAWLPAVYDQALYFEFIKFWGSHYITSSSFGGMAEVLIESSSCLNTAITPAVIEQMVLYDTQNVLHPGSVPNSIINAQYSASRKISSVDIVGGNPELGTIAQWGQRILTFEDDPVNLHFTYQPVSNLIADATKRANMARAIQEYLAAGAASTNTQKIVVDGLDFKNFMLAQEVSAAVVGAEGIFAEPPACETGEVHITAVIGGKSQAACYMPPHVNTFPVASLLPGGAVIVPRPPDDMPPIILCRRDPKSGLLSSMDNYNYSPITAPVQHGCAMSVYNAALAHGRVYHLWCCIGAGIQVNTVQAQYNVKGNTATLTCPPM